MLRISCLYGDIVNQIVESWRIAISRFVTKTNSKLCEMCVCVSNANPLHYYVLRVPRKVDRWR